MAVICIFNIDSKVFFLPQILYSDMVCQSVYGWVRYMFQQIEALFKQLLNKTTLQLTSPSPSYALTNRWYT